MNSDFKIDNLSRALPDIIIQNYEFRGDLTVEYLDNIEPYFPDHHMHVNKHSAIIINGRFLSNDEDVDIEIELYDSITWELLGKQSFYCPMKDMTCIHDAFLITVQDMLKTYILVEEEREIGPEKSISKRIIYSKERPVDNSDMFKEALSENAENAEFNINVPHEENHHNDHIDIISREFDFSINKELSKSPMEINTEKFSIMLDEFLTNPYNVTIGEMEVDLNEHDRDVIDFSIPLEFSIKKELVDGLLSDIPNTIMYNKDGSISIQFSNKNFAFDQSLITQLVTMRYQIIPVYSFIDEYEEMQLLVVDTWEKKYDNLLIGDTMILLANQYIPLYSIKSDSDNIYIHLDTSTNIVNYSFSVPYNTFGNYTKLIVDFMPESELDQYLYVQWGDDK